MQRKQHANSGGMMENQPFHHVSDHNKKHVARLKVHVRDASNTILNEDSPCVKEAGGHYIFQPKGHSHHIANGKLVKIEKQYFQLLMRYLHFSKGKITLEAKQAFEWQDTKKILEFIADVRTRDSWIELIK